MAEPLVPAEVNLRGLPWMRLDTSRLLDSDLFALSTGEEFKAAVALWCKSWTQEPAGSLPTDDRVLAHLSSAGARWKKVKAMALRGWVQCDDGRLYHPVVAEQVLLAWDERTEYRAEVDSRNERKRKERDERKAMFEALKEAGHTLAWNTPTGVLRDLMRDLSQQPVTEAGHTCHGDSHGLDGTGRDGTGVEKQKQELPPAAASSEQGAPPESEERGGGCSPAEACAAMIRGGLPPQRLNHADPRLVEACSAGATAAQFEATAREGRAHDPPKGPGWVIQAVRGRIGDAAAQPAPRAGPNPQQPPAMGKQMQGVMNLEAMIRERERLAGNRNPEGPAAPRLLVAGSDTCG